MEQVAEPRAKRHKKEHKHKHDRKHRHGKHKHRASGEYREAGLEAGVPDPASQVKARGGDSDAESGELGSVRPETAANGHQSHAGLGEGAAALQIAPAELAPAAATGPPQAASPGIFSSAALPLPPPVQQAAAEVAPPQPRKPPRSPPALSSLEEPPAERLRPAAEAQPSDALPSAPPRDSRRSGSDRPPHDRRRPDSRVRDEPRRGPEGGSHSSRHHQHTAEAGPRASSRPRDGFRPRDESRHASRREDRVQDHRGSRPARSSVDPAGTQAHPSSGAPAEGRHDGTRERDRSAGTRERDRGVDRDRDRAMDRDRDRHRERSGHGGHGASRDGYRGDSRGAYRGPGRDRDGDRRPDDRRRHDDRHGRGHRPTEEEKVAEKQYEARMTEALQAETTDEAALIEQRRKRMLEIKAKHEQEQAQAAAVAAPTQAAQAQAASEPLSAATPPLLPAASPSGHQAPTEPSPQRQTPLASPAATAAAAAEPAGGPLTPEHLQTTEADSDGEELDIIEQAGADIWQTGTGAVASTREQGAEPTPPPSPTENQHRMALANRRVAELDIFADNVDTILEQQAQGAPVEGPAMGNRALQDNFDDPEGYYNFQVGEMIAGRYEVKATHGKGVFSTVLLARDRSQPEDHPLATVAIKVIRAMETMTKAARLEVRILETLQNKRTAVGDKNCIRLVTDFTYRGHTCLVFEPMALNLRELIRKYGRNIGLNLKVVRVYTFQLLRALSHMRACAVLHADIKPDNILCDASQRLVKICDFGSAMLAGDNEVTPYLVSRFYRSPEVMLGLKYDYAMDMWAVGCTIYELYSGQILLPGRSNNEMLRLMMDLKGPFPKKMLKKGQFSGNHFEADTNMSFAMQEADKVTGNVVTRLIANPTVKESLADKIRGGEGEKRKLRQLVDLLDGMLQLDPERRLSVHAALKHPFIKDPFSS